MSSSAKKIFIKSLTYIITVIIVIIILFPIYWVFTISIKAQVDAFAMPPKWIFKPDWRNYIQIWRTAGFAEAFRNSIIIVAIGTVLALLISIPSAYAMDRIKFKGKRLYSAWLLIAYMFPEFLFIIPMYILWQRIGLYDTYFGVAFVYQVIQVPFCTWLLQAFFKEIPTELEDAAKIDGCNRLQTLLKIYLPLAAPGVSACAILCGIWIWNEVPITLAMTFSSAKTVTIAAAGFRGYGSINWGLMSAASMVSIVPMLIFAAFAQKYIVEGLTLGSIK